MGGGAVKLPTALSGTGILKGRDVYKAMTGAQHYRRKRGGALVVIFFMTRVHTMAR